MTPLVRKVALLSLILLLIAARSQDLAGRFALNLAVLQAARCLEKPAVSDACAASLWLAKAGRLGQRRAAWWEARLAARSRDPRAAVPRFRSAIALNPDDPFLPIGLLYALDAAGDPEAFLAAFAQQAHPPVRPSRDEFYDARTDAGAYLEASFDPNAPARSGDINVVNLLQAGRRAFAREDWAQARRRFEDALHLRPGQPAALYYLSKTPGSRSPDLPTQLPLAPIARADFDDLAAAGDPRLAAADVEVASKLVAEGIWSESKALMWGRALAWCCPEVPGVLEYVDALDRRDPSARDALLRGAILARQARYTEALAALAPEARVDRPRSDAWAWTGRIADALTGQPVVDRALAAQVEHVLERGVAVRPADVFLLHGLEALYVLRGDGLADVIRSQILDRLEGRAPADPVNARVADGRVLQGYTFLDEAQAMRDGIGEMLLFWEPLLPDAGRVPCYARATTCIEIASVRNLVPNGGFEWTAGEAGLPFGFPRLLSVGQTRPEAVILPPTDERAPGGGALLVHTTMTLSRNGSVSRDIAVEPGASYLLAATVRSQGGAGVSLGCELAGVDAPGTFAWAVEGASPARWTRVHRVFTVPPAVRRARIWVTGFNKTGREMEALADNISLIRLSPPRHP